MERFRMSPIARIVGIMSVVAAIWVCSVQQTFAESADVGTPAVSPPPGSETAGATPASTPDVAARRATCEEYVGALSGDPKRHALLESAEVQDLAKRTPDLLTCRAVKDDSDEPCKLLGDEKAIKSCRARRSIFHEWRAYPNGRAFMFNDVQFEDCRNFKAFEPYCEAFRAAARAGDASKCTAVGEFQSLCRALITLDKSLCSAPKGKEFQGRDKGNSQTWAEEVAKDCERQVESMALYPKGMKAVADSGAPLDRQLAKAALGQPDACAPSVDHAIEACVARSSAPIPSS
jgi:hypothetical protein